MSIWWDPELKFPRLTGVFPIITESRYTVAPAGVDPMMKVPFPAVITMEFCNGIPEEGTEPGMDIVEFPGITITVVSIGDPDREETIVRVRWSGVFIRGLLTVR